MQLLKMRPGEQQCMLYSMAMLLGRKPEELVSVIGHNGMEVWWPHLEAPYCRRGFHIQEMCLAALHYGHGLMPIEARPASQPAYGGFVKELPCNFPAIIQNRPGMLIGLSKKGNGHACAWDGEMVFDPIGITYQLEEFDSRECWLLI